MVDRFYGPMNPRLRAVEDLLPAAGSGDIVTLNATQTLTNKTLTSPVVNTPDINGGTADSLTSLSVRSTGAAFDLLLAMAEAISANRTLTFNVSNGSRTLTISGDSTINQDVSTGGSPTHVALTLTNGQIVFPATQVSSANANTLDDYEEGTFTPTVGDGTNNFTLDRAIGIYTKIGNMVFVDISVRWTSIGSAGASALAVKTLPFASNSTTGYQTGGTFGFFDDLDTTATLNQIMPYIGANSTTINFFRAVDNGAALAINANTCGATGEMAFSLAYRV